MRVLVLNSGSSSVKYQLVDSATGERMAGGIVEEVVDHAAALREVVAAVELLDLAVDAIGHRVVHGGDLVSAPTLVDDELVAVIRRLVPLAPLHNPANLAGIEAARVAWPTVPQVAVFDTAFHRTLPPAAYRYAVPTAWYAEFGVRRYGFHGTSHEFVSARAADVLGRPLAEVDLIVAHLGNGASMTAVEGGRSVETSMGLSPLEGLVMGTRSGDIDPAVVGYVAQASGRSEADVLAELNRVERSARVVWRLRPARDHGRASRPATRWPTWRSTCSATGSASTSAPTSRCSGGATRSCSRRASESTARWFALGCVPASTCSGSPSITTATNARRW